jgi:hypothetical protein
MRLLRTIPGPGLPVLKGLLEAVSHAWLACSLTALLAGCLNEPERKAGVDDFPNSIYAQVDGFLEEKDKAGSFAAAPRPDSLLSPKGVGGPALPKFASRIPALPTATATPRLPALPKGSAAAILSAAPLSAAAAAPSACNGTVAITETKPPRGSRITVDSLILCVDAALLDTIKGNERIVRGKSITTDTQTGRVEIVESSDGDGDGILNPDPARESKARIAITVFDAGVRERTDMVVGPGPDGSFDLDADNVMYSIAWAKTRGNDTLARTSWEDADGDGKVTADSASKVRLVLQTWTDGVLETTVMVVGFGPDGDFDTEADNLIYSLSFSRTRDGDTLAWAAYTDADDDGIAIDNGKPSLVDADWYAEGPTEDEPGAVWSRFRMRILAVYGAAGQDLKRFSAEQETRGGRRLDASIRNLDGGEDFDLADTVLARFRVVGTAPSDTVDTLETSIRMRIGNFEDKSDDLTYTLSVRARKKLGEERLATFDFVSAKPIPHGEDPELGDLTMRVEYEDKDGEETVLDAEGRITEETVDVTALLRDGKRVHAVWDREGKGISLEVLDP